MSHIEIPNVPDDVPDDAHTELAQRSDRQGLRHQQTLLDRLDRMNHTIGFTMQDTVEAIRSDRDGR